MYVSNNYVKIYEKMSSGGLEVSLSTDPDEIPHNAAFHHGLQCLPTKNRYSENKKYI